MGTMISTVRSKEPAKNDISIHHENVGGIVAGLCRSSNNWVDVTGLNRFHKLRDGGFFQTK